MMEEEQTVGVSESACKRRKSGKETIVPMDAEEGSSDSESPTNSARNDKSSMDSGISSKEEEKQSCGSNDSNSLERSALACSPYSEENTETATSLSNGEGDVNDENLVARDGGVDKEIEVDDKIAGGDSSTIGVESVDEATAHGAEAETENAVGGSEVDVDVEGTSAATASHDGEAGGNDDDNADANESYPFQPYALDLSNGSTYSPYGHYYDRSDLSATTSEVHSDDDDDDDDDDDNSDDIEDDDDEETRDKKSRSLDEDVKEVLNYPKPNYGWISVYELQRREHGLSGANRFSVHRDTTHSFNARLYASRHVVERMKLLHCLRDHKGCVNCLNFNRAGDLLCSGSDDTRIIVWHWASNKPKYSFRSGHTANIFQTKFIDSVGCLDIVSASRDGQVRRAVIPPSGGKPQISQLYHHDRSVHKIVVSPRNPFEILSAGEDGMVLSKDLRSDSPHSKVCKVTEPGSKGKKVRLFSIAHHPFAQEICVCGSDKIVRTYDKRNPSKPVNEMYPVNVKAVRSQVSQVTCSVYNSTGSEVLASYSDDHIYLFDNKAYKTGEYLHRYRGHCNHKTIKGVNFFGPNSEYIISGSDCGNIFFWDKNTEAIINFMPGDSTGVVNCLESHPTMPVLATSGLDHNIKIWTPHSAIYPPDLSKLETCIKRNLRRNLMGDRSDFDENQLQYFIRQFLLSPSPTGRRPRMRSFLFDESLNNDSSGSSSSSNSSDDDRQDDRIQCHTQ